MRVYVDDLFILCKILRKFHVLNLRYKASQGLLFRFKRTLIAWSRLQCAALCEEKQSLPLTALDVIKVNNTIKAIAFKSLIHP